MAEANDDFFEILAAINGETKETEQEKRRRMRGLPDEAARIALAKTYVKYQSKHWPELVKSGVLPKVGAGDYPAMAEQFRQAFESKQWSIPMISQRQFWKLLGTAYLRYSDDNSNPRSLDQQLVNVLEKAKQAGIFIPWNYVFADAAVTGTVAARHGYQLAKRLIQSTDESVDVLLIDEIGRASRDAIEALHLGRTIDLCRKRMIGASDGFDSASPTSKVQLHIYAMLHELFVDQLRAKVRRGMRDAFAEGKNIFPPAVGYKLVPVKDNDGNLVVDDDGRVLTVRVIDEEWRESILDGFRWYAIESWSLDRIARVCNERGVGGHRNWDSSRVAKMLDRHIYSGVEYYEKTYQVKDPASGSVTVHLRPESEWKRRDVPSMRIVPDDLWKKTQAKRALSREAYSRSHTGDKPSRTAMHPKTLVRPFCMGCELPLTLGRSGKYASYFCDKGKAGKHGCKFRGYKSARIIDNVVLEKIAQVVFTDDFMDAVVEEANSALKSMKATPKTDTAALEALIRKKMKSIAAITAQLDDCDESQNLKAVFDRVARMEAEVQEARVQLAAASKVSTVSLVPITIEVVKPLLVNLRELLQEDIGIAAPILADMTGPVLVSMGTNDDGEPEWRGQFLLNAIPALHFLAIRSHSLSAGVWERLQALELVIGGRQAVWLRATRKRELICDEVMKLVDQDLSNDAIARKLKTTWMQVRVVRDYASKGKKVVKPIITIPEPFRSGARLKPKVEAEVVRLRDKGMSFVKIAKKLSIDNTTASRVYE